MHTDSLDDVASTEEVCNEGLVRKGSLVVKVRETSGRGPKKKVIVISGPTAVGKTAVAFEVCKRLGGEIVSADSVQVYRGLDIGSAKTPPHERQGIPHHMLDIRDPTQEYTAGDFFEEARAATDDVLKRGRVPVVVGGTGLYLRWYIQGKPDVPPSDPDVTAEIDKELSKLQQEPDGWEVAMGMLAKEGDPYTAQALSRNDWYRLRRALEIVRVSGSPKGQFPLSPKSRTNHEREESGDLDYDFQCYFLYGPREQLYRRIDLRCEEMVKAGMLEEAAAMLRAGIKPESNSAARAIGYRQALDFLLACQRTKSVTREDLLTFVAAMQQASRKYAKRQYTWFRSEPLFTWLDTFPSPAAAVEYVVTQYQGQPQAQPPQRPAVNRRKEAQEQKGPDVQGNKLSKEEARELKSYQPRIELFTPEVSEETLKWLAKEWLQLAS